ncbi:YolD-like family protein [Metabacillus sp. 22489]|uniref:YolD-like family protein n=1 Tax=Metabacillus sp. 22489 TaxID=3453928 RepID=UPI003F84058C
MMLAKPKKVKKPARPTRDEFELEEIANTLTEALEDKSELRLTVWKREDPVRGKIVKMDGNTKLIHIENFTETIKVPFMDILFVQRV